MLHHNTSLQWWYSEKSAVNDTLLSSRSNYITLMQIERSFAALGLGSLDSVILMFAYHALYLYSLSLLIKMNNAIWRTNVLWAALSLYIPWAGTSMTLTLLHISAMALSEVPSLTNYIQDGFFSWHTCGVSNFLTWPDSQRQDKLLMDPFYETSTILLPICTNLASFMTNLITRFTRPH